MGCIFRCASPPPHRFRGLMPPPRGTLKGGPAGEEEREARQGQARPGQARLCDSQSEARTGACGLRSPLESVQTEMELCSDLDGLLESHGFDSTQPCQTFGPQLYPTVPTLHPSSAAAVVAPATIPHLCLLPRRLAPLLPVVPRSPMCGTHLPLALPLRWLAPLPTAAPPCPTSPLLAGSRLEWSR